jgi:hypothetical protein
MFRIASVPCVDLDRKQDERRATRAAPDRRAIRPPRAHHLADAR